MLHETEAQERKVGQCWGPRMEALPRSCNRVSEGGSSAPDPGGGWGVGSGICRNLKGSKAVYLEFHNLGKK